MEDSISNQKPIHHLGNVKVYNVHVTQHKQPITIQYRDIPIYQNMGGTVHTVETSYCNFF